MSGATPPHQGGLQGEILIIAFAVGVSFYMYQDRLPARRDLFVVALLSSICFLWFIPLGEYLGVYSLGYVVAYLGSANPRKLPLLRGADYSYGIFLYGFSIQQAFVYVFPTAEWYTNIVVCAPLSALVAAVSWHYVERPALKLKTIIFGIEGLYLNKPARRSG